MTRTSPSFEAGLYPPLKGKNPWDSPQIFMDGPNLRMEMEGGESLSVSPSQVQRLRFWRVIGTQGRFYEAFIQREGDRKPMRLSPDNEDLRAYATVMRAFASQVMAARGKDSVYRGETRLAASINLLLAPGSIGCAALVLPIFAFFGEPAFLWIVAAALLAFAVYMAKGLINRMWPRPITALSDLDDVLPVKEGS